MKLVPVASWDRLAVVSPVVHASGGTGERGEIMGMAVNARVAGLSFLLYIAAGMASLFLTEAAAGGGDMTSRLASMEGNAILLRYTGLLDLLCAFCALVLAVSLYALTSAHGASAAMLAMVCRVVEGVLIATSLSENLGVQWLAGQRTEGGDAVLVLASYLARSEVALISIFFATGSLLFSWLFVRGRLIPAPLAWLGVLASLSLVVVLPLQLVGYWSHAMLAAVWLPMLLFEVPLALWLIFRGVRPTT